MRANEAARFRLGRWSSKRRVAGAERSIFLLLMKISARVRNKQDINEVVLQTHDRIHSIDVPAKSSGPGSDVNGGELLFLALATCYCNDVYREAAKRGIAIEGIDVEVQGDFGAEGAAATGIVYRARVTSPAQEAEIRQLLLDTDAVAEVHNTLRAGTSVRLDLGP
jgi:uncharacterized OsmC-like protein